MGKSGDYRLEVVTRAYSPHKFVTTLNAVKRYAGALGVFREWLTDWHIHA